MIGMFKRDTVDILVGTSYISFVVIKSFSTLQHYVRFKFAGNYISNYAAFCGIVSDVPDLACYLELISKCRVSNGMH